jgi:parallel beta-helix repeat protein
VKENNNNERQLAEIVVPDDYSTIQEAINNAQSGDKIYVKEGTYEENIKITKSIELVGESMDFTIISGVEDDHVVDIEADGVTVEGFTIQNSGADKAGVYIDTVHYAVVRMNIVQSSSFGIKLFSSNGNNISDNFLVDNLFNGFRSEASHMTKFSRNVVEDNGVNGLFFNFTSTFNDILGNRVKKNGIEQPEIKLLNVKKYGTPAGLVIDSASRSNSIKANAIEENIAGVSNIGASENNQIFKNDLRRNLEKQAFDTSISIWNADDGGNYWGDYAGEDADGDGIGDTPYAIEGGDNQDHKPLVNPLSPVTPVINGPSEVEIAEQVSYHVRTLEPLYEEVVYLINWGDSVEWERSEPVSPDEGFTFVHEWDSEKTFRVRVRAVVKEKGETVNSDPSAFFPVRVPHNKINVVEDSSEDLVINDFGDILKSIFSRFQNSKIFSDF